MQITRTSQISGIERTMEINVTQEELDNWKRGMLIQRAMPNISSSDREFILTGITQEEWDEMFGNDNMHEE